MKKRPPLTRVEHLKEQAERLQAFLEAGGHSIQRRVVLEAVAAQHNSPNWNTLQATAAQQDAEQNASGGPWLITQHFSNRQNRVTLADSFIDGLRVFCTLAC